MKRLDRPLRPLWYLLPSGFSVPFVGLGTAWLLLFGSCGGVLAVADVASGKATTQSLAGAAGAFGIFLFPVGSLLLFASALLAGKWAARTLLFGATLSTLGVGLVTALLSCLADPNPAETAVIVGIVYAVPVGIVALALLVSAGLAVREVRSSIDQARRERLRELLSARGELDYASIAKEIRLSPARVPPLLDRLVASAELTGVLDHESQVAFSLERFAQKQRDLVSVVWGRGKASLAVLAEELRLSPARVHELLAAALATGAFTGFVDTRTGEIVSAPAAQLRHGRTCPSCGGRMDLAGHGVVVCQHCQAEVFLDR